MTFEPEEEPARTDSPAGHQPTGEPGVSDDFALTAALAEAVAATEALEPAEPAGSVGSVSASEAAEPGEAAEPAGPRPPLTRRARVGFRDWRRARPFWGGLLVLLGGGEIIFTYHAPMALVMHFGLYGLAGYLVPGMLVLLGVLILFDPQHRTFYSVLAVLAALGSWLTSNLGGFIVGMLLGLIGGSMAFGWQVGAKPARKRGKRYRPSATH
ncbi:hypothetical protein KDL01_28650 [Actinospica durhamensis]|uniref:Uncharacterized protein n=1 Tax=Actinospica durhamensis TaxID=1508375 RepID=A0A941IT73_9ACTN|nr:DUF6114 domain-containing protein [Actinospica durhamensis]MBR7837282.1 hypothetical protein [Actinospica durhamensis]